MTDKERSKEIEDRYEPQKEVAEYAGIGMILGDYEFLIQQAKRAQELEEQNQRYKQALEEIRGMSRDSLIDGKYFEVSNEALEGENE